MPENFLVADLQIVVVEGRLVAGLELGTRN
jgi:hypothetical protein